LLKKNSLFEYMKILWLWDDWDPHGPLGVLAGVARGLLWQRGKGLRLSFGR
jgi:hypothetical protein